MEFSEFIKTPKVDGVTLRRIHAKALDGTLCITAHHFILSSRNPENNDEIWVLHSNVDSIEKKLSGSGGTLFLHCKDFHLLHLDIPNTEPLLNVASSLEKLSNISHTTSKYPYFYRPTFDIMENGWLSFLPEREFARFKECSEEWRLSYVNKDYQVCSTYPHAVIVPKTMEDAVLVKVAAFRQGGRFPVLSYYHCDSKSVLLRSSQPMTGQSNRRCKEDEKYLGSILGLTKRGYIIDTRSSHAAKQSQTKGGGFEYDYNYCQWKLIHQPVERSQNMHDSLIKMIEAISDGGCATEKWLSKLESSNWLTLVKDTMTCACLVAQSIDKEFASVLVHGGEGTDTTLLITSLVQVILDHDCRTVNGFEALIEREWLQAGHPFESRCNKSAFAITKQRQEAPVFLLFLDCVWQIVNQFPCSFEFSERFLVTLFEHAYSSQFGTFLCDNEKARKDIKLSTNTVSLWSYLNRPETLQQFLNPLYDPNPSVIWPSVAPQSLQLWSNLYQRHTLDTSGTNEAWNEVTRICDVNKELCSKVSYLRRQLASLERDAVAANVILPAGLDLSDCQED